MLTFYAAGERGFETTEAAARHELVRRALWIDLLNPTRDEEVAVERALGLEIPTREEMQEIELSRRLYKAKDVVFVTATVLSRAKENRPASAAVTFILTPTQLITLRYSDPIPFQNFAQQWNAAPATFKRTPDVFAGVMDAIVERLADILEGTSASLDALSVEVLGISSEDVATTRVHPRDYSQALRRIGMESDIASRTRESVLSISRAIAYVREVQREEKSWTEALAHLQTVATDLNSLADHANFLSGKISFLLDATLGLINNEQNAVIKIISVAAMVIGPPTLIAGIYGMNFVHMPEFNWWLGYPFALLLMLISGVAPYVYFKRRRWL